MSDGKLFSHVYLRAEAPTQDSGRFRTRLYGYLHQRHSNTGDWYSLSAGIKVVGGLNILGNARGFENFLHSAPVSEVLDFITIYWRREGGAASHATAGYVHSTARRWREFVKTALEEENLGYRLDSKCGVHYFVDEEFERNRLSALQVLDAPQLGAVRGEFEAAHGYLDPGRRDTKASVRAAFEAVETLALLIYPDQSRLTRNLVLQRLRPDVQSLEPDETAKKAVDATFNGIGDIVDGAHEYRHGKAVDVVVAPTLEYAVFFLSTMAAVIRYIVPVWTAKQVASSVPK